MYSWRGRGGGRGGGGQFGRRSAPKGVFKNHQWYCECTPREIASKFQVKKEGGNKGKWFYTCQKTSGDESSCRFFLWNEDAKKREERVLAKNTHSENDPRNPSTPSKPQPAAPATPLTTTPAQPQRALSPPPPFTVDNNRRKRGWEFVEEADEFGFDQDDDAFNEELDEVMTAIETPSRKAAKIRVDDVPARRRLPWMKDDKPKDSVPSGLPTPQTERRYEDPFPTRFTEPGSSMLTPSRYKAPEEEKQELTPTSSRSFDTPTPARFQDVAPSSSPQGTLGLSKAVFSLLEERGVDIDSALKDGLGDLLSKNTHGKQKTSDYLRQSIKAKDAKIVELQHRINTLEAESQAEKTAAEVLRDQLRALGTHPEV